MTHSDAIDAYDRAKRDHASAPAGARVETFVRLLVLEMVLTRQLGISFDPHLSRYRERWSP